MRKGNHIDRVKSEARSSESAIHPKPKERERERPKKREKERNRETRTDFGRDARFFLGLKFVLKVPLQFLHFELNKKMERRNKSARRLLQVSNPR